jgi:hypothetical protein
MHSWVSEAVGWRSDWATNWDPVSKQSKLHGWDTLSDRTCAQYATERTKIQAQAHGGNTQWGQGTGHKGKVRIDGMHCTNYRPFKHYLEYSRKGSIKENTFYILVSKLVISAGDWIQSLVHGKQELGYGATSWPTFSETSFHYAAQAGLKFMILLNLSLVLGVWLKW